MVEVTKNAEHCLFYDRPLTDAGLAWADLVESDSRPDDGAKLPALLPQVYLHYDPKTGREREGQPSMLMRERMSFLLLLPRGVRIVLKVDGKQHHAEGDTASPNPYSEMVLEDRRLKLRGYEVYRFGGHELTMPGAADMLRKFFGELLARHDEI